MYFYEMEKNVFHVTEKGCVVICCYFDEPKGLEGEGILIMSYKSNGEELSDEEYHELELMLEELRDEPKKYMVELYDGTLELLEEHFGYCLDVEKKNNKFYGYLND